MREYAHMFDNRIARPISQPVYIAGIRPDLDAQVARIRQIQIQAGMRKLCPRCRKIKLVSQFAEYQSQVCCDCEAVASRSYNPVSFLP